MKKQSIVKKIILCAITIIILSFILSRNLFYEVPILTYHRISSFCFDTPLLCVSPKSFQRQMDFISSHRYQVISLEELVNALSRKKNLPRKTVVITFDDGTEDVYQYGFPILKKYGFAATIFILKIRRFAVFSG
ncbi:MAG: polysaccharide deacetylase family protein [Candidatus Omnitrophota bacterium]|nr:polysaccharide deacetylase family protein [Candidatus Omnitrophota bacterium]